jgi:glutathione synthase/RimK-type ligase-like ATP-grasp enzyme
MTRVAFVTHDEWPNLTPDDNRATDVLRSRGVEVVPALWDDAAIDWAAFDAVVLRSTWDYHKRGEEFKAWLDKLETQKARVWNPPSVVRWNMDKNYLRELGEAGRSIAPSAWFRTGDEADLSSLMQARAWSKIVMKPIISAAAENTYSTDTSDVATVQTKMNELLQTGGVVVQEFMPEVQEQGEWSLIFFNKQFSHAALKKPAKGDFRSQRLYGGTTEAASPPDNLVAQAKDLVDQVSEQLLYARVDCIVRDSQLYLMEFELIEPFLFLEYGKGAAARFADTVQRFAEER